MARIVLCPACGSRNDTKMFSRCRVCNVSLEGAQGLDNEPRRSWATGCGCALAALVVLGILVVIGIGFGLESSIDLPDEFDFPTSAPP